MLHFACASDHKVETFANILRDIEPDFEELHATMKDLKWFPKLEKFISHYCYECKYIFDVNKCGQEKFRIYKAP